MTGLVASPTHPRESLDASANATVEHPASQTLEPETTPRQLRTYGPGQRSPPALIALTETAQFCSSKVLTAWLRH